MSRWWCRRRRPGSRNGGPWQFPLLQRLADGRLLAEFQKGADSATDYGLPMGQAVSDDNGASWHEVPAPGLTAGLRLPNGDELRAIQQPSVPLKGLAMPKPWAVVPGSYDAVVQTYYWRAELPADLPKGWAFLRRRAGGTEWVKELAQVTVPDQVEYATEGVYMVPFFDQDRIHVAPNGRLQAMLYWRPQMSRHRTVDRRYLSMLLESADQGRTWTCKSTIPYCPGPQSRPRLGCPRRFYGTADRLAAGRVPAGLDADLGRQQPRPAVCDAVDGWRRFLGETPGLQRPDRVLAADSEPEKWRHRGFLGRAGRLSLLERGSGGKNLERAAGGGAEPRAPCGYSDLLALNDHEFLIVYSNFDIPDRNGQPRKTILCRKVTVRKTP